MKKYLAVCIVFLLLCVRINGQEVQDSIKAPQIQAQDAIKNDTVKWVKDEKMKLPKEANLNMKPFKPNPTKAVLYSAIFPGLGQIYNRKYWKLPIVYGGFLGLSYAITWNGGYYNDYNKAYRGILGDNPRVNYQSWIGMAPWITNPSNLSDSEIEWLKSSFRRKRDFYRRNRDLSIIGAVALYAVCMIDAYVDAHLFDFDMSPDLSMRVEPVVMDPMNTSISGRSFGVQCSFKF